MLQLICLDCDRANADGATVCAGCGAALLRKFCDRCHAVNSAESSFCRSCGGALAQLRSGSSASPLALTTPTAGLPAASPPPRPAAAPARGASRSLLWATGGLAVGIVATVVLLPRPSLLRSAPEPRPALAPALPPVLAEPAPVRTPIDLPPPLPAPAPAPVAVKPAEAVAAKPPPPAPAPQAAVRRPAPAKPAAPPRECNATLDALALCTHTTTTASGR